MPGVVNRMKPVPFTAPDGTETPTVGVGREGVLNGATSAVFGVDLTGLTNDVVARVYLRPTIFGKFVQNGVSYTLPKGAPRRLDLSALCGYEVKITLEHTEGVDTDLTCEWQAQRGV